MRKFKHLFLFAVAITFSGSIAFGQGTKTSVIKPQSISHDGKAGSVSSVIRTSHNSVTSPDFSTSDSKALLYSNGPFRTDIGTGPSGGDVSMLAAPLTNYGFGHNIATFAHVADDVLINATSWTIDSLVFYAYQTNSTLTSTFTAVHVAIWDGDPSLPTSTIVWGDTTTNVLSRTVFSGCYRANVLTGATRPIMRNVVNVPAVVLTGGSYWIQWASAGSLTSGPWANPITITGQAITGNAKQKIAAGAWGNLLDGTNGVGLPFEVYGTEVAATCPFPSTLAVTNITDISASLGWTETGSATTWNIEYGVTGFTQGAGTAVNGTTTNPYALAGLTANTTYDFYVQSDCGGSQSLWAGPFTFSTLACAIANQCDYVIDFTDTYGDGWNGAALNIMQNGVSMGQFTLAAGSAGTQTISLCDASAIDVVFVSGSYDEECGFVLKDPFGTTLFTLTASTSTAAGSLYTFTSACTPPACMFPSNLNVGTITLTSAVLNWTNGATETAWNVQYGAPGFTLGTGTIVPVTSHPYTLNGLTAGTGYAFYVQADCGGAGTSTWVGPITFSTACNIVNTFPWIESFEGAIFPTPCWTKENLDLGSGWDLISAGTTPLPGWTGGTMTTPTGGGNNAAFCTYTTGGATSNDQWLISPQIAVQANHALSFQVYWFGHYQDNLTIKVSTTTNASSSFTTTLLAVDTNTLIHDAWKLFTIDISSYAGQNVYFAFNETIADNAADGAFLAIDLVTIDVASSISQVNQDMISIYPNPAYNTLNIANAINPNVNIYNSLGELVLSGNKNSFDISALSQGLYIVKVTDKNQTYTKQINILK